MPLHRSLVDKIEDFFEYFWANDRLRTLKASADAKILNELQDSFV